MWSTCSIDTGHACTHAPQVTQSHTDSSGTAPGDQRRLLMGEHEVAQAHDHELGGQRLVSAPGRARVLAAAALRARVGVEHLLPGQVGRRARPEPELLLRYRLVVEPQRLQPAARAGVPEPHVDRRSRDVQVLGAGQVGQEREDRQHVRPDEHPLEDSGCLIVAEQVRQRLGDRGPRRRPLVEAERDPGGVPQQQRDHDRGDQRQDQVGLTEMAALEPARPLDLADPERGQHADQHQHAEQVDHRRVPALVAEPGDRGVLVDHPDQRDQDRRRQHQEAPEDECVHQPGTEALEQLALAEHDRPLVAGASLHVAAAGDRLRAAGDSDQL